MAMAKQPKAKSMTSVDFVIGHIRGKDEAERTANESLALKIYSEAQGSLPRNNGGVFGPGVRICGREYNSMRQVYEHLKAILESEEYTIGNTAIPAEEGEGGAFVKY
ncbi:MAG: hypothetical protein QXU82_02455 [Candidatus Aenigmatarchaeota archaeon]